jgi:hypothetical protein
MDTESTKPETAAEDDAQRRPVDALVSFTHAYMGLCIRNDEKHQVVNVHSVHDGQVYYGRYSDLLEDDITDGFIGAYRSPENQFNDMIGRAVLDGAAVYTLLEN